MCVFSFSKRDTELWSFLESWIVSSSAVKLYLHTMLSCDICGETVTSEPDMKAHLTVHMENEVICPFCKLPGINYDEMCFHIETAHFEQNMSKRNFEKIDTIQYGTSYRKDNTLQSAMEVNSDCDHPLYSCPMCGLICTDYHILQEHVDLHLEESSFQQGMDQCSSDRELAHQLQQEEDRQRKSEESRQEMEEFQKLQGQYGLDNSGGYKQQQIRHMEIEVNKGKMHPFEFHQRKADMMEALAIGIDDGQTKTSGITEALHRYYQNTVTDVKRVWLSTGVDHFHSALGDKGWGCGYRNFQMLLSSLLKNDAYDDCLKGMSVPCIPKIQSMIENAWKEGFDPQGASQLNNKLQGTKAWIGACEIYTLLTSLRVKCRIIDFHKSTGPLDTHPCLFEWILNYYSSEREGNSKVICTFKPPVYLQHQGHSRTIVGIEEKKNQTLCLLIFDPGWPSQEMQKLLKKDIEASTLKQLRKTVGNLKHKQYQIVAVEGTLSPEEKVARKQASQVFTAEKIP
uniref:zinc finger-containing ubiquitin peptidase 1 isoform X2 n=1 Tax=Jaculus jaculus TaxID=51337 RepID=UPI001E1B4318|nr:zinc finger-containing ubiquitin peptidase 1 isoform X2 [Jaculus jaculus]